MSYKLDPREPVEEACRLGVHSTLHAVHDTKSFPPISDTSLSLISQIQALQLHAILPICPSNRADLRHVTPTGAILRKASHHRCSTPRPSHSAGHAVDHHLFRQDFPSVSGTTFSPGNQRSIARLGTGAGRHTASAGQIGRHWYER